MTRRQSTLFRNTVGVAISLLRCTGAKVASLSNGWLARSDVCQILVACHRVAAHTTAIWRSIPDGCDRTMTMKYTDATMRHMCFMFGCL